MNQKIYYNWLDISKGIGIILVILGHCLFPCHSIIDIFHMPLFFLLAGITFHEKPADVFIISKINRIFIPYIFWSILSALFNFIPHNYGGKFNGPLWFFPVMFATLITMYCIHKQKPLMQYLIITIFFFASWFFIKHQEVTIGLPFSFNIVILSTVYMFIGYIFRPFIVHNSFSISKKILICCSFIVGFLIVFSILYKSYNLSGVYVSMGMYKNNFLVVFLCSLLGIFSTISLSILTGKSKILEWFGKNSLTLMCVHFPFANSYNVFVSNIQCYNTLSGKIVLSLIEYIIVFGISIVLTFICKKFLPQFNGYSPLIKQSENNFSGRIIND